MRNTWTLLLGIGIIVLLLLYMVTYEVNYNQVAVLTTFGKVAGVTDGQSGSGALFGNLRFKWPAPIQVVTTFDARNRIHNTRIESLKTKDSRIVTLAVTVNWRIAEAEPFYRFTQDDLTRADQLLNSNVRSSMAVVGNYTLGQLTSQDEDQLKLDEVEASILAKLRQEMPVDRYGMEFLSVGIPRNELPGPVTEQVFEQMKETRQRIAQRARSEGDAEASRITAAANSAKEKILAFANRRALEIRAEGEAAAQQYYQEFEKDEDFAIFLRRLQALEQTLKTNTTFILDTEINPFDMLVNPPADAAAGSKQAGR